MIRRAELTLPGCRTSSHPAAEQVYDFSTVRERLSGALGLQDHGCREISKIVSHSPDLKLVRPMQALHNSHRAQYGAKPLSKNSTLEAIAAKVGSIHSDSCIRLPDQQAVLAKSYAYRSFLWTCFWIQ